MSTWLLFTVVLLRIRHVYSEILINGDFENGVKGWYCRMGCHLTPSDDAYEGTGSAKITQRINGGAAIAQHLTVKDHTRYKLTGWIKFLNLGPGTLYDFADWHFKCFTDIIRATELQLGLMLQVRLGRWTKFGGYHLVSLPGLHDCNVHIDTSQQAPDIVLDSMSLMEIPENLDWREEANTRIDEIRKSNVEVRLVNAVPGAYTVEIKQTKDKFGFGTAVDAHDIVDIEAVDQAHANYLAFLYKHFEWAVLVNSLNWNSMEPNRGTIDYETPDRAITELNRNGMKIRGHSVFSGSESLVPDWLKDLTPSEVKAEMKRRIDGVVSFTKGRIQHWDVNGDQQDDWYEQTLEDPDATLKMFSDVNAVDGDVKLFLNEKYLLTHKLNGKNALYDMSMAVRNQALYFIEKGIPAHGIGIQSHLTPAVADMTLLKERLDTVAEADLPIWISELTVNAADPAVKAQVLSDVMTLYFSHPAVEGVILWGFWDGKSLKPNTALFEGPELTPNEAGAAYLSLMKKWRTEETLVLTENESKTVRCFKGEYSVVVKRDGDVVKEQSFTVNEDTELAIDLEQTV